MSRDHRFQGRTGYVLLTAAGLLREYADKKLLIYNKGISGNKVFQLIDRWDADTLALNPNVLSIHIGVNDFWHTLTSGYTGRVDEAVKAKESELLEV